MPGTVTVGCKIPNGLNLCVYRMKEQVEQTPLGERNYKIGVLDKTAKVRGPGRMLDDPRVSSGYALTHNVDADLWKAWLEQNKEADAVKNRMVFAFEKTSDVHNEARAMEKERCGLEPLDPQNLPKDLKGKITTADRPKDH